MDRLLEKNTEGAITAAEKTKLEALVAEAEQLMVANAKRMAEFARQNGNHVSEGGVPVTVWVQPTPLGS
ncbi:MAG TPA: hypothetical protein VHR72_10690 [Gemmataceae bacterium]|nr:hypothetical protein [Gemmataceae bacterium]